ncbi:glycosyltransferase family 2 protein [Acinetobacter shaoyimingii]|uniref:Glycosyltransferase family 2 protein n=1 Tax=Acinetobacter shaoyimingii TaxID=2715164 RepID=A0A6G8RYB0_9GAMM|nr:glycosyltransferase family 2 protein [Acinetobacter shaoyimingii]QIO06855.1 glycosyltransferase family 2 protein [Acinetobacter shaoyimingii]
MQLSILIVNYNTENYIEKFLNDLNDQTLSSDFYEVIITNNVQNEKLRSTILNNTKIQNLNIKIVDSERNLGFGRAMNLAAKIAQGHQLLIANPDLRMLENNYLEKLLKSAESHNNYGIITTQILNDDNKDTSEYRFYEFGNNLGYDNQTNWFCGALLLIKKEIFEKVSGFDPDFFMYCEDEDLCLRIKKLNLPLVKLDELSIYHKGGSSEPLKDYAFYHRWFKSKILFANKHYSSNDFKHILDNIENKAIKKYTLYKALRFTGIAKYKSRYDKWNAMKDCVQKTKIESVDWLYFK